MKVEEIIVEKNLSNVLFGKNHDQKKLKFSGVFEKILPLDLTESVIDNEFSDIILSSVGGFESACYSVRHLLIFR